MESWEERRKRLEDEMQQHIDLETQENIEAGMSRVEARQAAMRRFGSVSLAGDQSREAWGWLWPERLWQDVRYALRSFRKNAGFTSVALLSLMLGIGASIALFSVVYGVLIAPYPYARPNQIWAPAVVGPNDAVRGWHWYSQQELEEIQKLPAFSDVMATLPKPVLLTGGINPENFYGVFLTGGAFNFLGVKPLIGRTLQPFDIGAGSQPAPVVVLSYGFWQRFFSGDPHAIGRTITLDNVPRTVIGVMPPRFGWWTNEAFWLPLPRDLKDPSGLAVIVRLAPGVTQHAAEQELNQLNIRFAAERPQDYPKGRLRTIFLNYMDITAASGDMSASLHLLLAAVGLLLLIACVNVANLQLARTTGRAREIAMRIAIGAGRGRLVRQLLTESVLLSVAGGVLGVLFALGATRLIVALIPPDYVPNEARIAINGWVLLFSLGVSMFTGILFGLAPALRSSRPDLVGTLKDGRGGATGSLRGRSMRSWLVVAEISLSVMLLAGASLAVRGFIQILHVDPGFQPARVLRIDITLAPKRYPTWQQRNNLDRALLDSVMNLPGVQAADLGNGGLPYGGDRSTFSIPGEPPQDGRKVSIALVSRQYPQTLGIPLRQGREFTEAEIQSGMRVALINESAARLWPSGENPIGRTLQLDDLARPFNNPQVLPAPGIAAGVTVVGVIGDTRNDGLNEPPAPAVFLPYTLVAPPDRQLAVRTASDPLAMINAVRMKARDLDKDLALGKPNTLDEVMSEETQQPRFNMALFSAFAGLGLALAAIGIYSVISYNVSQRVQEIGVRMALGAKRGDVLKLILLMVTKVAALGLVIGLVGAVLLERLVQFQMFAKTSFGVIPLAAIVVVLAGVSLLAAWLPATRAGNLDPVTALRHEA
ncbi:MAG TPA: ABC transporter permease [Acidobacteriaceae bacterium]|jgi:predicted permease|nr:ABC transporter permease [Acidobacteriaceae bacterium]